MPPQTLRLAPKAGRTLLRRFCAINAQGAVLPEAVLQMTGLPGQEWRKGKRPRLAPGASRSGRRDQKPDLISSNSSIMRSRSSVVGGDCTKSGVSVIGSMKAACIFSIGIVAIAALFDDE